MDNIYTVDVDCASSKYRPNLLVYVALLLKLYHNMLCQDLTKYGSRHARAA